jgi:hypothetical protein
LRNPGARHVDSFLHDKQPGFVASGEGVRMCCSVMMHDGPLLANKPAISKVTADFDTYLVYQGIVVYQVKWQYSNTQTFKKEDTIVGKVEMEIIKGMPVEKGTIPADFNTDTLLGRGKGVSKKPEGSVLQFQNMFKNPVTRP